MTADTLYTATITTMAKDLSDAALPSAQVWSFTTLHNPAADSNVLYYADTFGALP